MHVAEFGVRRSWMAGQFVLDGKPISLVQQSGPLRVYVDPNSNACDEWEVIPGKPHTRMLIGCPPKSQEELAAMPRVIGNPAKHPSTSTKSHIGPDGFAQSSKIAEEAECEEDAKPVGFTLSPLDS